MEQNIILEIKTGSHLYGTNVPTSDIDYVGIYIPSYFDYLTSDKYIKELDMSVKSKGTNGKNLQDAIDRKFYTYSNFIKLATANNPTILEMLFVNDKNIVKINDFGRTLIENRHMFLHKGLIKRFKGYSKQQSHKMEIKSTKYHEMIKVLDYLKIVDQMKVLAELKYDKEFMKIISEYVQIVGKYDKHLSIGDINIPMSVYVKDAVNRLQNRIDKATHRSSLILDYGFDTKFAQHLIRLLIEGVEFLKYGELRFPLIQKDLLLDIRNGKMVIEEVFKLRDKLLLEIESLEKTTKIPAVVDVEIINKFRDEQLRLMIKNGEKL